MGMRRTKLKLSNCWLKSGEFWKFHLLAVVLVGIFSSHSALILTAVASEIKKVALITTSHFSEIFNVYT